MISIVFLPQVQYASLARSLMDNQNEGFPKGTILKEFPLNGGSLSLEATLNKSVSIGSFGSTPAVFNR